MLSWALPASACPGGGRILGCVPAPSAPESALLDSRSRPAAPSAEPPRAPRAAPAPQPPPRSRPRAPRAAPGPAVRAAALRELGALSRGAGVCYCPGEPEGIPALLGPAPTPCEDFPPGKVGAAPASPGRGSPVLGTLAPASARLLAGPLPLGGLCFFISFSLSSYLDRSANSSHCSIPAGLSLNLRPNS